MNFHLVFLIFVATTRAGFINPGTPDGVPSSFDCAVRYYAYEYGQQIQSRHGTFTSLFDSLQLAACNYTRPDESPRKIPNFHTQSHLKKHTKHNNNKHIYIKQKHTSAPNCTFYIDPVSGSDSNSGTSPSSALLTIQAGVTATRNAKNGATGPCILNLMEGTFYLDSTIILTAEDSYLTIQNYNGAEAIVSGGLELKFKGDWELVSYEPTTWQNYSGYNNVFSRANENSSSDITMYVKDCKVFHKQLFQFVLLVFLAFFSFIFWYLFCFAFFCLFFLFFVCVIINFTTCNIVF